MYYKHPSTHLREIWTTLKDMGIMGFSAHYHSRFKKIHIYYTSCNTRPVDGALTPKAFAPCPSRLLRRLHCHSYGALTLILTLTCLKHSLGQDESAVNLVPIDTAVWPPIILIQINIHTDRHLQGIPPKNCTQNSAITVSSSSFGISGRKC